MAITNPIPRAALADILGITDIDPHPGYQKEQSGLGSGQIIDANLAPAVRALQIRTKKWTFSEAAALMAVLEVAESSGFAIELYDPRIAYPPYDPDGTILGLTTVTINALNADNKRMKLAGAPEGYRIDPGCFLSWDFGDDDEFRAYHRVCETATFDGSSITNWFEVRDFLDPGSSTGIEVTVIKPCGLFKIRSGSVRGPNANRRTDRISFDAYQVFEIEA